MTPPWGINWLKYHQDMNDLPHVERMGYASFTIFQWMWNNRDFCNELVAAARKDAIFLNRDQPLSEQKDDQFIHDPAGKGRAHADDWAQKVKDGKVFTPLDRTYFLGLNEPNSNLYQVQIDAYNEAYCRRMTEHGLRVAAYSFGVGHPSTVNLDPKGVPDWHWYEASAAAILEGDHIVATHEYGSHDNYGWGYWCGRIAYCPHPFTVVFDECGIDNGVTGGALYGYQMYMKPLAAYCNWLDGFQVGQAQRAASYKVKVHSYNIFCYDFGTSDKKDWASYDIRPIRPALEAFQWSNVPMPTTPPVTIHLPDISTGTQAPAQSNGNWERAISFVLGQEGGLSNDPNDQGNYVDGKFVGSKYGISAAAHPGLDIPNLTLDQAKNIYYNDYWLPSGASNLDFPLSLAVMDLAVNGGVGRAQQALAEAGQDFDRYNAWRLRWYTSLDQFDLYGPAWIRRVATILEASKA